MPGCGCVMGPPKPRKKKTTTSVLKNYIKKVLKKKPQNKYK